MIMQQFYYKLIVLYKHKTMKKLLLHEKILLQAIYYIIFLGWAFVPVYMASGVYTMPEYLRYYCQWGLHHA